jgi:hypothetical protein
LERASPHCCDSVLRIVRRVAQLASFVELDPELGLAPSAAGMAETFIVGLSSSPSGHETLTAATESSRFRHRRVTDASSPPERLENRRPSTRSDIGGGRIRELTTHRKVTRNGERRDGGDITLSGGLGAKL